jgi:hypothetical protein
MKNLKFLSIVFFCLTISACTESEFADLQQPSIVPEAPTNKSFSKEFDQNSSEKIVDLLVVVDNSTSMTPDQEKLAREFANFVDAISEADYRIGVITTDTDSSGNENRPGFHGNLDIVESTGLRYITKQDANPEELFSKLINRKETKVCEDSGRKASKCPSFEERPLLAIKQAIDKRNSTNLGFFRKGADLGVIIISDEDETDEENSSRYYSAQNLLDHFSNEFNESKKMTSFSITILEGDEDCWDKQAAETNGGRGKAARPGLRIGELSNLTGGFNSSICSDNYGTAIQEISNYVEKNLIPIIVDVPDSIIIDSIKLSIVKPDGSPFEAGFTLDGKQLRIFPSPPKGSKVTLTYKY